jgi:hypothetical protein
MPIHGRTLCWGGGGGGFVYQNALPFGGGKIQFKEALGEYKYAKEISLHLYGYLFVTIDYFN